MKRPETADAGYRAAAPRGRSVAAPDEAWPLDRARGGSPDEEPVLSLTRSAQILVVATALSWAGVFALVRWLLG